MLKADRKALLIFPNPISEMPIAFAYLSAVLRQKGYDVKAVVNTFNNFLESNDFVRIAEDYKPSFVGFNITTFHIRSIYETIAKIKKLGIKIIAGGAHPTTYPEEVLKSGVDIIVRNEGELTLAELCDYWNGKKDLSLESIKGISFRGLDGKIYHNSGREYISDLAHLPEPDFTCFDHERFRLSSGLLKGLHRIYCSRGCPACCTFCDRAIFGQKIRYVPIENIIREIKKRKEKYNVGSFIIADDTFTANKKYVQDFCEALIESRLNIIWNCATRANMADPKLFALMKKAGCYMMGYGIESADPETLKRVRKGITLEQAHKAVDYARDAGFRVYVNLMTGFPWENESAVNNNIKYIRKHFNQVHIYQGSGSLVPYPGSDIYRMYKDKYGFNEWWLRDECQDYGIQIHQNAKDPYKHSTFYQRHLYDDTYVWEDTFFKYKKSYKKKVKEMAFLIGKRNLLSLHRSPIKRWVIYILCKLSHLVYELNPRMEKAMVSKIVSMLRYKSCLHDGGPLGYINKAKKNNGKK